MKTIPYTVETLLAYRMLRAEAAPRAIRWYDEEAYGQIVYKLKGAAREYQNRTYSKSTLLFHCDKRFSK
jgi:hypothetical protein